MYERYKVGPSRRDVLAGGGAMLATGALGGVGARAQATAHTIKVGAADITILSDGEFTQPLSLMLPGRPETEVKELFAKSGVAFGPLRAQVNVVVVRMGGQTVLLDAGSGPDFMPTLGRLADRLELAGIKPESVTQVVFTHAHADHLWGVIDPLGGGSLFDKARHVMTAAERDFWLRPGVESEVADAFKPMAVGTQRRLKSIADRIEVAKPGQEIAPGIALVDTAGHTPGHVSVLVRSGSEQVLVGGDVLTQAVVSFVAPDWRWGPDMDSERAVAARQTTLDRLASESMGLIGYHLPWPGVGRVERKDAAFRFVAG